MGPDGPALTPYLACTHDYDSYSPLSRKFLLRRHFRDFHHAAPAAYFRRTGFRIGGLASRRFFRGLLPSSPAAPAPPKMAAVRYSPPVRKVGSPMAAPASHASRYAAAPAARAAVSVPLPCPRRPPALRQRQLTPSSRSSRPERRPPAGRPSPPAAPPGRSPGRRQQDSARPQPGPLSQNSPQCRHKKTSPCRFF